MVLNMDTMSVFIGSVMDIMKDQYTTKEDKTMLTRIQKERKAYKAFIWVFQLVFVVVCLTAMVSITVIGLIG